MSMIKEFKEFAMRGNVIDLAVAVVIGAAFGKIVTSMVNDILMPPTTEAARSEELWRHTCFEAFVRASSAAEYYEFNFSPSTPWSGTRDNGKKLIRGV